LKILLVNVHSSHNAGDEALTLVTLRQLQEQFPDAEISIAVDDPASGHGKAGLQILPSFFHWATRMDTAGQPRWQAGKLLQLVPAALLPALLYRLVRRKITVFTPAPLRGLISQYLQADLVVSKPGGFLYSSGSGVTLTVALLSMGLGMLAGKPLYIYPQSFGPLRRGWEKKLVRQVLQRARIVMVREPVSMAALREWDIRHSRCLLIPDSAFGFEGAGSKAACELLAGYGIDRQKDRPLLGMTAIHWGAENKGFAGQGQYEAALAEAAQRFQERHGGKLLLLPQVTGPSASQDDRVPARRIAQRLGQAGASVGQIDKAIPPALLRSIYGQMDIFLGTRMHSNIFAISEAVPVLAVGYQHKTRGIIEMLGLERWTVDIQDVDGRRLAELLEELWQERGTVRDHLENVLPEIRAQAEQPGRLIADDYYRNIRHE
jgi:colanic acid/amylovoran biosynthesis protein